MRKIGVFGGSFNPIHIGHVALARELCQSHMIDELWMLVSPLNPLKQGNPDIADYEERLEMARLALKDDASIKVSDFEATLPIPSYTYTTLHALANTYPEDEFHLVIGADNWLQFGNWYRGEDIVKEFRILMYARPGCDIDIETLPASVTLVNTHLYDISSTLVRQRAANGLSLSGLVPPDVENYIKDKGLYQLQKT